MLLNKKVTVLSALVASTVLLLTGCGSESSDSYATSYKEAGYAAEEYDMVEEAAFAATGDTNQTSEVKVQDTSRKLIKNVDLNVETNDLDAMMAGINERINAYGGYVEDSYVYNGSGSRYSNKNASIKARIPADKLDEFINNVAEVSNVISKNINVTDVTLEYVDTQARKDSLDTQQKRLLELMEQAETVEDIIYIEDRLTDIRYQLDSAERQIRTYDNQVNYSTVNINVDEVKEYTPVEEKSRWETMIEGFIDSIQGVCEGILDFIVGFIIALPYLVVWGLVIFIIVFIVRKIVKHKKTKKNKADKKVENKEKIDANGAEGGK